MTPIKNTDDARNLWRKLALGTASSIAMTIAMTGVAQAQDAAAPAASEEDQTEDEDVIVVSGFRASLETAQNIKRDSDTFVDVITAEDIGALPDRSVAEALQRVPGVNIGRFEKTSDPDRFSVEGTGVIVRGLPFVRTELNGRDIFSATGGTVLSFNDLSPELLGRVEVFKNVTADMIDGGIAGNVIGAVNFVLPLVANDYIEPLLQVGVVLGRTRLLEKSNNFPLFTSLARSGRLWFPSVSHFLEMGFGTFPAHNRALRSLLVRIFRLSQRMQHHPTLPGLSKSVYSRSWLKFVV